MNEDSLGLKMAADMGADMGFIEGVKTSERAKTVKTVQPKSVELAIISLTNLINIHFL